MITLKPIGVIHSPFAEPKGTPVQPPAAKDVEGVVEVYPEFAEGLQGVEGFSHLILIYYLHLCNKQELVVKPFLGEEMHGVFATRAPGRPNLLGMSVVRLIKVKDNKLHVKDVDIVEGTLLLDIKPYVAAFDVRQNVQSGWFEKNIHKLATTKDDGRFAENAGKKRDKEIMPKLD